MFTFWISLKISFFLVLPLPVIIVVMEGVVAAIKPLFDLWAITDLTEADDPVSHPSLWLNEISN